MRADCDRIFSMDDVDVESNIRVIAHQKSNLALSDLAQTFGLDPATGLYWEGETDAKSNLL